jgi:hypothetical protein
MQIRDAILAAASHIERNPGEFAFSSINIPDGPGCGTPGCAIGWIAAFRKGEYQSFNGKAWNAVCNPMGINDSLFYDRMCVLDGGHEWKHDAARCAGALRAYAYKYHPARPLILPDWNAMAAVQTVGADESDHVFAAMGRKSA